MRLKRLVLRKTTSMHGNDKVSIQTKKEIFMTCHIQQISIKQK